MKRFLCIFIIAVITLSCISCSRKKVILDPQAKIDKMISSMSLEEKVGQLFVFSIALDQLDEATTTFLNDTKAGNIILFSKNAKDANQLVELNKSLQDEIIKNTKIPALIGIDQEGGQVTRIYDGATFFPGAMAVSAAGDPSATYTQGQYMGEELRALGINFDFAPVVDINSNPQNPVINSRSYGDNSDTVSAYSSGMIKGLQEQGVIACAKHFPGHGDTTEDSHVTLPTINKTLDQLKQVELIPFQNAINNGVDAIMVAHILFPQIEKNNIPATLSKTFLTNILRNQMGFNGLIVTDSLKMDAIKKNYDIGDAAVMAVNAGANLIVTGSGGIDNDDITYQTKAYYTVLAAVKNSTIPQDTLYKRVRQILEYKQKYGLLDNPYPEKTIDSIDWAAHKDFADQVSLNSITKIQERKKLLPVAEHTLVISNTTNIPLDKNPIDPDSRNSFAYLLAKKIGGDYMTMPNAPTQENILAYVQKAKEYDKVVIASNMASLYPTQADAINRVIKANANTIVVSLGAPYDMNLFKNAGTLICAYEYTPPAVASLLKVLTGEAEAKGILPVKIP